MFEANSTAFGQRLLIGTNRDQLQRDDARVWLHENRSASPKSRLVLRSLGLRIGTWACVCKCVPSVCTVCVCENLFMQNAKINGKRRHTANHLFSVCNSAEMAKTHRKKNNNKIISALEMLNLLILANCNFNWTPATAPSPCPAGGYLKC